MELILLFSCQTIQESREFVIDVVIESALKLSLTLDLLSLPEEVDAHPFVDASEESLLFDLVCHSSVFRYGLTPERGSYNPLTVSTAFG